MWLHSLAPWFVVTAMVSQPGAAPAAVSPALPELISWRKAEFSMPFVIERSKEPSWQPTEAQLYFSTDRGAHWRLHTSVPVDQRYFKVRTSGDGEYWLAIRTVNRAGQGRPETIRAPDKRILVDTKPPVLRLTAQPDRDGQVIVHWEIEEPNLKPESLNIVYRPSATEPWQAVAIDQDRPAGSGSRYRGEVKFWPKPGSTEIPIRAVVSDTAGNSAVGNALVKLDERVGPRPMEAAGHRKGTVPFSSNENRDSPQNEGPSIPPPIESPRSNDAAADVGPALTSDSKADAVGGDAPDVGPKLPVPPPAERSRMVNSRTFELEYDVDSVGPSGVGRVELWGTRDSGQTWRSYAVDSGKRGPLRVSVKEEGVYGFRVVVTNGAGFGGKPPVPGDPPDLTIGVDLTKPTARIVSAKQGTDSEAGQLIISWQADDQMLAARPVSISFSESRSGPWLPVAAGLENAGRYAWSIDNRTPAKVYLRLEVRDEAGNVATHETTEPVVIDQSRPTVRIRSVRPVTQPIGAAMRQR